jgi:hypothetical protein
MSTPATPDAPDANELHAARFAQLVMQQANLATLLLGRTPHPETGQTTRDLEAAQMFIDQLEMLEAKTRGNLSPAELSLLRQTLMSLRLAFVEAADARPADSEAAAAPPAPPAAAAPAPAGETGKRFSKSYPG